MSGACLIELNGLTWDNPRGYEPLVATLPQFYEKHENMSISWEKRSLNEFGDTPLHEFASEYDLIIIDHPSIGEAVRSGDLINLDKIIANHEPCMKASNYVGKSFESYRYGGHLWALPIDAACQVSARRNDMISHPPSSWEDVLTLSRNQAKEDLPIVALPSDPTSCFCTFYSIYANIVDQPYADKKLLDITKTIRVLDLIQKIFDFVNYNLIGYDPPTLLDEMSTTDEIMYIPLTFGYSNYSRRGYRDHLIHFGNIPSFCQRPKGSILGGAGISISKSCEFVPLALSYVKWITSSEIQEGYYFLSGGQPAHEHAWGSIRVNSLSNSFFASTRTTIENASLRPRSPGFLDVQIESGKVIYEYIRDNSKTKQASRQLADIAQDYLKNNSFEI